MSIYIAVSEYNGDRGWFSCGLHEDQAWNAQRALLTLRMPRLQQHLLYPLYIDTGQSLRPCSMLMC